MDLSNVTAISQNAFKGCKNLSSVTLSSGATEVGASAFEDCTALESVDLSNVTAIPQNAFKGCKKLSSVTLCGETTEIGKCAFSDCIVLENLDLSSLSSLKTIGEEAFNGCAALISPNSEVTTAYVAAKEVCPSSEKITDENVREYVKSVKNAIKNLYGRDIDGEDWEIIEGVTGIYGEADERIKAWNNVRAAALKLIDNKVEENSSIYAFNLPSNLESIGEDSFKKTQLRYVSLGEKGVTIGKGAFSQNDFLKSVVYGASDFSEEVFSGCSSLKSVTSSSVNLTIASNAFSGCSSLASVEGTVSSIGTGAFNGAGVSESLKLELAENANISSGAFNGSNFKTISLENLESIPDGIYKGSKITSVTIPESVTSISADAFSECTELTSVTIPANVESISANAFSGCTKLTSVTIPAKVKSIGANAFNGCSKLETLTFENTSSCETIEESAFKGCVTLESVTIPANVESIGANAFNGCSNLETLTFADTSNCGTIGENAFDGCALTQIILPTSVTSIGANAFNTSKEIGVLLIGKNAALAGKITDKKIENLYYLGDTELQASWFAQVSYLHCYAGKGKNINVTTYNLVTATLPEKVSNVYFGSKAYSGSKSDFENGVLYHEGNNYVFSHSLLANGDNKLIFTRDSAVEKYVLAINNSTTSAGASNSVVAIGLPNDLGNNAATTCEVVEVCPIVTFDSCDGKLENVKSMIAPIGREIILPTPVREGYRFDGWTVANGEENLKLDILQLSANDGCGDIKLKAKWLEEYYVKVDYGDGDAMSTETKVCAGDTVKLSELKSKLNPKTGYTHTGWKVSAENSSYVSDYDGKILAADEIIKISEKISGAIVLIPQYTANTYKLKFDLNGMNGVSIEKIHMDCTYGEVIGVLPEPKGTPESVRFDGWYYGDSSDKVSSGSTWNFAEGKDAVAKWTPKINLTVNDKNGGIVSCDGVQLGIGDNDSKYRDLQSISVSCNEGYYISSIMADKSSVSVPDNAVSYTYNGYDGYIGIELQVNFKKFTREVVVLAAGNNDCKAMINEKDSDTVERVDGQTAVVYYGSKPELKFELVNNYYVSDIIVNGDNKDLRDVSDGYTLDEVKEKVYVIVIFKESTIKVNARVNGENGTITPGEVAVSKGSDKVFSIHPDEGYEIESITKQIVGDSGQATEDTNNVISLGNGNYSYTLKSIQDNYNVEVKFKKIKCSIDCTGLENGTVTIRKGKETLGMDYSVEYGEEVSLTITPNSGYYVKYVRWNGESEKISGSGEITLTKKITGNSELVLEIVEIGAEAAVEYKEDDGASVTKDGIAVKNGEKIPLSEDGELQINPPTGSEIDTITLTYEGDGETKNVSVSSGNILKLSAEDLVREESKLTGISITFKHKMYTATVSAMEGSENLENVTLGWTAAGVSASDESSYTAEYGTVITLEATPKENYHIARAQVGDSEAEYSCFDGKKFTYTIGSLTSNVDIKLEIKKDEGKFNTSSNPDVANVDIAGGESFAIGETRTIIVTVQAEKNLLSVKIGGNVCPTTLKDTKENGERVYTCDYVVSDADKDAITVELSLEDRMCKATWQTDANQNQSFKYGTSLEIAKSDMKKDGYTFTRDCLVDGKTVNFEENDGIYKSNYEVKSDITLEPHWTPNHVKLNFNVDGGDKVSSIDSFTAGTVERLPETAKAGYTFKGWLYNGQTYQAGGAYTVPAQNEESITFTAQWEVNKYKVGFMNDNTMMSDGSYRFGTPIKSLMPKDDPTKVGHKFIGWSMDSDRKIADDETVPANDVTLYALWEIVKYNVTFDYQDGVTESKVEVVNHGNVVGSPNQPKKDGNIFSGWSTNKEKLESVDFKSSITQDVTYYAIWEEKTGSNTMTVVVDGIQRDLLKGNTVSSLGNSQKDGYTFKGWSLSKNEEVLDGAEVLVAGGTYYPVFKINEYTVTFINGKDTVASEKVKYEAKALKPEDPEKEGYKFSGWQKRGEGKLFDFETLVTGNLILDAQWDEATDCTITFNSNGGSEVESKEIAYNTTTGELPKSIKSGAIFLGWYEDGDFKTVFDVNKRLKSNKTLYAKWNEKSVVEVTVDGNKETVNIYDGTTVGDLIKPTKSGYVFGGWYEDAKCEKLVSDSERVVKEMKLYAKWNPVSHTLKFLDGAEEVRSEKMKTATTYKVPGTSKDGYEFKGWKCRCDGKIYTEGGDFVVPAVNDSEIYFDGQFEKILKSCVVIPVIDGKAQDIIVKTVDGSAKIESLKGLLEYDAEKQSFKGWYSDSNFKNLLNESSQPNDEQIVYARIESNKKQVSSIVFPEVKDLEYGTLSIDEFNKTIEGGKINLSDGSEVDITNNLGTFEIVASEGQKEIKTIEGEEKETLKTTTTRTNDDGEFMIKFVPSEEANAKYNFDEIALKGSTKFMVYVLGDINGDGKVGSDDAQAVLNVVVGKMTLSEKQMTRANVYRKGDEWNRKLGSDYSQRILNYVVKKIDKF